MLDPLTPPISPSPERIDEYPQLLTPTPRATFPSFSNPQNASILPAQCSHLKRVLVLCFDGTGNKFGEGNSNILRLCRALKKGNHEHQIVYYQPSTDAYHPRAFIPRTVSTISGMVDFVIARHLDVIIKDWYKFLVSNYQPGDRICLFGFSRGAHVARALAGMIYKVGILPRDNFQQVDFAFNIYMTTGYQGTRLSREFKSTFTSHIDINFVGVWDTIFPVGLIPQLRPFTSVNYGVKCFRHALALDECRAMFRPDMWAEETLDHDQELDVDLPIVREVDQIGRSEWQYMPPQRDHADVKEVWFAGTHSDVGGASHPTGRSRSLSYIPLRWMIKECILAKTGIQFDLEYLRDSLDFDFSDLLKEMKKKNIKPGDLGEAYLEIEKYAAESELAVANSETHSREIKPHSQSIWVIIFKQFIITWLWWIFEVIPMLITYQDPEGNWIRLRTPNLGRGRYIPFDHDDKIYIHNSVQLLVGRGYEPKARNWASVKASSMLEYAS